MKNQICFSIRTKLILLVIASVAIADIVILTFSLSQDLARYSSVKIEGLFATAETIAASAAEPTARGNVDGAYQAIRAMGRIEGLTYAAIQHPDGTYFADLGATEQLASDLVITSPKTSISIWQMMNSNSIEVDVPITYGGELVGNLQLIANTADLPQRIESNIRNSLAGGAIALVLALLIALQLQRRITRPLAALTRTMSGVRANHDYEISLKAESHDEVGILVDGFNGMIADIRDRDRKLAQHLDRLEQDVADRTADYQNAARDAEAANRAKSDFLATMSHEIRTPMNGILVMAELLAAGDLPEKSRRHAEVIARSGTSLLAIINDILDISKIEAGKLEVEMLEIDPIEAVDTVLRLFADRAQGKGLDLVAQIDIPQNVKIAADPTRLGQVLANLVNNALKFTQTGGVVVRITSKDPNRVSFAVTDTGIGIAADKLGTIFEAFSQADQTTTRNFGGTGLGLTIARRLVSAMGGEIEVTSTEGVGTTFFFSLEMAENAATKLWSAITTRDLRPLAVICFEGQQTREALQDYLEAAGFDVVLTGSDGLSKQAVGARLVIADPKSLQSQSRLGVAADGGIISVARADEDVELLVRNRIIDAVVGWPLARQDIENIIVRLNAGQPLTSLETQTSSQNNPAPLFKGLAILVADDAEVNREVADAALQRLGIKADFVEDGRQAVDAAMARQYDLILMDGSMPEIDGFDATRMIRSLEAENGRHRTSIVALTAHVIGTSADAWREAGMDGVLHKPFTLARMAECIETHTGHKAKSDGSQEASASASEGVLDTSVLADLLSMTGGMMSVVDRITGLYCTQASERIRELRHAVTAGDLDALGKTAHAIKSMSFNVGARGVAELAARIEQSARQENRLAAETDLNLIAESHERAIAELKAWRESAVA